MSPIDWLIVASLMAPLIWLLFRCNREVKNTSDFLTAGRCAGRYLLSISGGIGSFGLISAIAMFELYYNGGLATLYWGWLSGPLAIAAALSGWIYYRYRETRCMTVAQFLEVRYNRRVRILAGTLAWVAGVTNYGIFPAVGARFIIHFCRLPERFELGGMTWDLYPLMLGLIISTGIFFAIMGGQIAIMITDFAQGMFCNLAFLVLLVFFAVTIKWETVSTALSSWGMAHPEQSMINPFKTSGIRDFNLVYFAIGWFGMFFGGIWQGSSGYQVAAKSAHEAKMANLLGSWRGVTQWIIMIVIPITAFAVMHSPEYAAMAAEVDASLGDLRNPQLKQQMIVPMVLTRLLPIGLTGLFVAVMLAAMISTDNTYMHSWGSIFIQDVIMPFRKKPFAPKTHLLVLRCSIVGVGVYAFFFSLFFRQTEHILLFWAITGAIFSGSGAAIVGGLYTRWGTASGATAALSIGAAISIGAILLQQYWRNFASLMFNAFPNWTFWVHNSEKMPVNGQVVWFFCLLSALISYVVFSLLSPARKRFDLRGMLHRDETGGAPAAELPWYQGLTGITAEFTFSDKIIAYAAIGWSLWWFTLFIAGQAAHFAGVLSDQMALRFWFWYFMLFFVLSFITTAWFSVAGLKDVAEMFKFLSGMKRNNADDGRVIDGKNAGE